MNLLEWVGKYFFDHAGGKGTKSLTKTNTFDENLPSKILVQRDDVNMTGSKVLLVVRILIAHMTMTLKIATTAGTKLSDHDCFYHHRHHRHHRHHLLHSHHGVRTEYLRNEYL